MKYIKFFEGFENVQDLCNRYLPYLIDEDFLVEYRNDVSLYDNSPINQIIIKKDPIGIFDWNNIKDYVIPFLKVLMENYNVEKHIYVYGKSLLVPSIQDLIDDVVDNDYLEHIRIIKINLI